MNRPSTATLFAAAATLALASSSALADDSMKHAPEKAKPPANARFEALKALAGEWTGTASANGKPMEGTTRATVKVVSAGSAVMLVTDPGTPHEMVTMFHEDDGSILATHYCAAKNQPRMKATTREEPGRISFEFVDGTNLKTYPGHMTGLVVTFTDGKRHVEEWIYGSGEKRQTMTMELARP